MLRQKRTLAFALCLTWCLNALGAGETNSHRSFADIYAAALKNPDMDSRTDHIQSSLRFVFVKGFLNEGIPGYFSENIKALIARGVPEDNIHVISPSSGMDVMSNVKIMAQILKELRSLGPEKLVLIGHSKGGSETFAFALSHTTFVQKYVHQVYIIQGCLNGSLVADYTNDTGPEPSDNIPWFELMAIKASKSMGQLIDPLINDGLSDMTTAKAKTLWQPLLMPSASLTSISKQIFYVVSKREPDMMSRLVKSSGWYLWGNTGDNDGLIGTKDQSRSEVGSILAVLDADHAGLTVSKPVSNVGSKYRTALMVGILNNL